MSKACLALLQFCFNDFNDTFLFILHFQNYNFITFDLQLDLGQRFLPGMLNDNILAKLCCTLAKI